MLLYKLFTRSFIVVNFDVSSTKLIHMLDFLDTSIMGVTHPYLNSTDSKAQVSPSLVLLLPLGFSKSCFYVKTYSDLFLSFFISNHFYYFYLCPLNFSNFSFSPSRPLTTFLSYLLNKQNKAT
jgi:hypothetical protein